MTRTDDAARGGAAARRVALVAPDLQTRTATAEYLTSAGFQVHPCAELGVASPFSAVVLLSDQEMTAEALSASIKAWLKSSKVQRIVVVTAKPNALKSLLVTHADRLVVLAAPAFGWDVVDALRANPVERPPGA